MYLDVAPPLIRTKSRFFRKAFALTTGRGIFGELDILALSNFFGLLTATRRGAVFFPIFCRSSSVVVIKAEFRRDRAGDERSMTAAMLSFPAADTEEEKIEDMPSCRTIKTGISKMSEFFL